MTQTILRESPSTDHATGPALPVTAEAMRQRLEGTNIHSVSFLATDYLNHFNEVVMMLEMVADMPDMLEDIAEWEPKSYAAHFRDSGFADRALAIAAYDLAPAPIRARFDALVAELDGLILDTISRACGLHDAEADLAIGLNDPLERIRSLLGALNGVIHGAITDSDDPSEDGDGKGETAEGGASQADIDALFD